MICTTEAGVRVAQVTSGEAGRAFTASRRVVQPAWDHRDHRGKGNAVGKQSKAAPPQVGLVTK